MHDDKEVECYANWLHSSQKKFNDTQTQEEQIRRTWLSQRNADEGCTYAFEQLLQAKQVNADRQEEMAERTVVLTQPSFTHVSG
jgi:soluble lytic murein transglycosylase